ncbi:outer membrane lipoprotein-sorting protein [Candidatus Dependentiae bacterium]|nr:outer membrane lipoprotein-sorting protein [Candidatus Dependentiae bacterium]
MSLKLFKIFLISVIISFVFAISVLADKPAANELLVRADKIRNPEKSFKMQATLIEYRNSKETQKMVFSVYSKPDEKSGEYNTIIKFVEPSKDKGKLMLKDGANIWFFDPMSKSTARISPQQRLMGQTSNGDVMTITLNKDYNAKIIKEETIVNADKQKVEYYMLELTAKDNTSNYFRIEYWIEKETAKPVKGNYYSASDRLTKIIFYRNYRKELGMLRPTEAIIIDGIDKNFITRMIFGSYQYIDIKDEFFQKSALAGFNLE